MQNILQMIENIQVFFITDVLFMFLSLLPTPDSRCGGLSNVADGRLADRIGDQSEATTEQAMPALC